MTNSTRWLYACAFMLTSLSLVYADPPTSQPADAKPPALPADRPAASLLAVIKDGNKLAAKCDAKSGYIRLLSGGRRGTPGENTRRGDTILERRKRWDGNARLPEDFREIIGTVAQIEASLPFADVQEVQGKLDKTEPNPDGSLSVYLLASVSVRPDIQDYQTDDERKHLQRLDEDIQQAQKNAAQRGRGPFAKEEVEQAKKRKADAARQYKEHAKVRKEYCETVHIEVRYPPDIAWRVDVAEMAKAKMLTLPCSVKYVDLRAPIDEVEDDRARISDVYCDGGGVPPEFINQNAKPPATPPVKPARADRASEPEASAVEGRPRGGAVIAGLWGAPRRSDRTFIIIDLVNVAPPALQRVRTELKEAIRELEEAVEFNLLRCEASPHGAKLQKFSDSCARAGFETRAAAESWIDTHCTNGSTGLATGIREALQQGAREIIVLSDAQFPDDALNELQPLVLQARARTMCFYLADPAANPLTRAAGLARLSRLGAGPVREITGMELAPK